MQKTTNWKWFPLVINNISTRWRQSHIYSLPIFNQLARNWASGSFSVTSMSSDLIQEKIVWKVGSISFHSVVKVVFLSRAGRRDPTHPPKPPPLTHPPTHTPCRSRVKNEAQRKAANVSLNSHSKMVADWEDHASFTSMVAASYWEWIFSTTRWLQWVHLFFFEEAPVKLLTFPPGPPGPPGLSLEHKSPNSIEE